jgi:hypothetical protein
MEEKGGSCFTDTFPPSEEKKNEWALGHEFALNSSSWAP